ncbi:DUF427 domain-containing protein [Limibacillus halophilus]|uniref:Class 3 adenylate cyclase/uncharacterized protein (DUF427 family) n=1 Tax=Limibacillus halophilus TaxID=1579333 RepID=A0A839SQ28_9PROT|nr:DUF427 domain-containing protein [Limibacillus halophilus]MBB3064562.1 class 3 adenylate cyclase/uncharacterized protein (DUF427 family) [Limibacillus halophilus]
MPPSEGGPKGGKHDYAIVAEPAGHIIKLEFNGVVVAESDRAIRYREAHFSPVYYFPRDDVRMDLMKRSRHRTHCPFKGNASYWTLVVGNKEVENAVWSYENPLPEADAIKGYLSFYLQKLGASYSEDGDFQNVPNVRESHGTPFIDWVLHEGWDAGGPGRLTRSLAEMMRANGMPISRLSVFLRTLHPLLIGSAFVWRDDKPDINSFVLTHDTLSSPVFLDSPLVPIFNGAGGIRRRLEGANPMLDFGILHQLHKEGMTDYAAMPMLFSDGQINVLTLSTREVGGFSTAHLGMLHEILPVLSRLFEVYAARSMANTLLQTYLGRHTGERVMRGLVKRGDAELITAAIWFCDLRQSTSLAESMPAEEFLEILNNFFECMVRPIVEYGGEVLNFIGDAVLGVFPLANDKADEQRVCEEALMAAAEAEVRMKAYNDKRVAAGGAPLDYGIGLHLGQLTYGNIGIPERLEFTVIGSAANKAARIESLTKEVEHRVLTSIEFAKSSHVPLQSIGSFPLRGLPGEHEIFVPTQTLGY